LNIFALRTYHMVEIRCSFKELDQIQIEKHDRIFGWARWTGKKESANEILDESGT